MQQLRDSSCDYRSTKSLRRHIVEIALMLLVFGPVTLFFTCDRCFDEFELAFFSSLFSGMTWVLLWKGNELGAMWLDHKIKWFEAPVKRFFASFILTVVYTTVAVGILHYLFFTLYIGRDFYESFILRFWDQMKFSFLITFVVSTFLHGRGFLYSWRQTAVDIERLKSEQLSSQYESLKKQIDPHFLFNSLNTLSSLVHKDSDLSEKFIKQLAKVYRYVLDSQEQEVVSLKDEMAFTDAYIFLQKIRHGDSLIVNAEITDEFMNKQVPPFVIQMLVENAIKHNIVSESKPLKLQIKVEEHKLEVSNNLQLRKDQDKSSGLGLNNIKMRYEYLSDQSITINQTNEEFKVSVPLLNFAP